MTTRQLWLVAWTSVLSLLGTNAWADGMIQHSAPAACCEAPFAGAYIGVALGYAQQRVDITNELVGAPTEGVTFKDTDGGFTFGGYAGYNWQRCCSPFVFGVETDFNSLNTSPTAHNIETGPTGLAETASLKSKMNWSGTLRGRVGFVVHDNWLVYATGGVAYAQVDHKLNDDCVGCSQFPPHGLPAHLDSPTKTLRLDGRSAPAQNSCTTPTGYFARRRFYSTFEEKHIAT